MANDQIRSELSLLTDPQLEEWLKSCVSKELEMKIQILHLLAEVENRRLYSHTYPSLFEYCTRELKYSAASAQRRIDTMRAMKLMPEIEQKLQSGTLQLSTVAKVQSFFRHEAKAGKPYSLEDKREVLAKVESKSLRECEKELVSISPQSAKPDLRREITQDKTELRLTIHDELVKKLDHLKSLLSNKHPHLSDAELIEVLADMAIKRLDPSEKNQKTNPRSKAPQVTNSTSQLPAAEVEMLSTPKTASPEGCGKPVVQNWFSITQAARSKPKPSRYIPATMKQDVWMRDKGRCTHFGCNSNHKLQYDHIKPIAKGGETSVKNLRLLCQTHNLLAAQQEFGHEKMAEFIV